MSVTYAPVKWNTNKKVYDAVIAAGIATIMVAFLLAGRLIWTGEQTISFPILLMRALGTCAFFMLHVILCIGPLARLDRRFLPLVNNRRHLGVATFLVGAAHAIVAVGYYHGFGSSAPIVSLLSLPSPLPFEWLGLAALSILFLLAATSHDFWQKTLGPSIWKWLHMLVYPAYGILVAHILFGSLRTGANILVPILLAVSVIMVVGLHLAVGRRERRRDEGTSTSRHVRIPLEMIWVDVGSVNDIPVNRAMVVCLPGRERIAVFKYDGCLSAVTNVCAHQRGPLGEGKIIDGCITCPWHGWEYRPADGCSPPPFQEKIATYRVRLSGDRILIDPNPLPPGTAVEPARIIE